MKPGLYWSYATRSLIRGGQRTVLAIFCVAVGVMAIVALQLVGISVNQALLGNIIEANGGGVRLKADLSPFCPPVMGFFFKTNQQGLVYYYFERHISCGVNKTSSGGEKTNFFIAVLF